MKKNPSHNLLRYSTPLLIVAFSILSMGMISNDKPGPIKEARAMPVYGNWRNFTTKDGLPADKAYTVRIDGKRVLAGTSIVSGMKRPSCINSLKVGRSSASAAVEARTRAKATEWRACFMKNPQ